MPLVPLSFTAQTALLTAVLLLPFAGFVGIGLGVGRRGAGPLAVALTTVGLLIATTLAANVVGAQTFIQRTAEWAGLSGRGFAVGFRVDALTALMLVLVHGVALLVQVYSLAYLRDEPRLARYFSFLQLFVGAMLGIVMADNLVVLYAFWELVGLASYLLIGFWSERPAAAQAAKKAFLMNRIGDVGLLIGIFLTYVYLQTTQFGAFVEPLPTVVGLCLFMGCVGKSAQFPLLTWLPDAMEGPTPVSALLHAATMVAAGVFLLARIFPLLSPEALLVITSVGTITTLWGGLAAVFQTDVKRVLAFSTVSQLGLMVAAVGTGNWGAALFHLLTHAFVKAGLFLGAGTVIHAVHTQDMRQLGGLRGLLPQTYWVYVVCAGALAGVPGLSGFLSKETVLAGAFAWAADNGGRRIIPLALLLSSGLTALYMTRQVRLIFWGVPRAQATTSGPGHASTVREPSWPMRLPMLLLAGLSLFIWFSPNPFSAETSWFFRLFSGNVAESATTLPTAPAHYGWLAPVSIALVALGGWLGWRLAGRTVAAPDAPLRSSLRWAEGLSLRYGYLDELYDAAIVRPVRRLALLLSRADQHVVDGLVNGLGIGSVVLAHVVRFADRFGVDGVVNGTVRVAGGVGRLARAVQSGRVQSYIAVAFGALALLIWWLL